MLFRIEQLIVYASDLSKDNNLFNLHQKPAWFALVGLLVIPSTLARAQRVEATRNVSRVSLVADDLLVPSSALPLTKDMMVAVDINGDAAWFEANSNGPIGTMVLGSGSQPQLIRFAKKGNGPGEVRNPWFAAFSQAGLLVYEPAGRRVMQFDRAGRTRTDKVTSPVVAVVKDRVISLSLDGAPALYLANADLSGQRRLTSTSDTTWLRLVRRHLASQSTEPFATALVGDTVYLSTTISGELYRLAPRSTFLRFGPEIPPRLRTKAEFEEVLQLMSRPVVGPNGQRIIPTISADEQQRARREYIRQISPFSGLQVDGQGRLWRIRSTPTGALADIFSGTSHVQTIALPCSPTPRGISIAGRWLLLACLDRREDAESEVTVRRYRF